mmetsp:Transcript_13269/g.31676  ORF Transcript_13269/g.31676 Transcript_13269/m.31676 type:complete len:570 (+) Transcript_13269:55-1764(+)
MACLVNCAAEPHSEDLSSSDVTELIREHHAVLMRILRKQQTLLEDLYPVQRPCTLPSGTPRPTSPVQLLGDLSGDMAPATPALKAPDCLEAATAKTMTLQQLDNLQELMDNHVPPEPPKAVRTRTQSEVSATPKSRVAARIQARLNTNKKQTGPPVVRTRMEKIKHFTTSGPLDLLAGFVILINALVLIVEQQLQAGVALQALDPALTHSQALEDSISVFMILEQTFLTFYVFEMVVRVVVLRREWYWQEEQGIMWGNFFDALLVTFGLVDLLILSAFKGDYTFSAILLRMLKVTKVVKTMRLVRVMHLFTQLRGMVDVFRASLAALFWSVVMLLVCMMIASLILCEACYPIILDPSFSTDLREWIFVRYGSFTRSMYSFFEITFSGGWPGLVRRLVDEVSVFFTIPCLLYVVLIVFAGLRLITALFVRSTMHALSNDAAVAVRERIQHATELQAKLHQLFDDADIDDDKSLTLAEWEKLLKHPEIVQYLSTLEVDVHDAKMLFHLLDDGDGMLTVQEFCEGMPKVRGNAKSLDIVCLMHETDLLRRECQEILREVREHRREQAATSRI